MSNVSTGIRSRRKRPARSDGNYGARADAALRSPRRERRPMHERLIVSARPACPKDARNARPGGAACGVKGKLRVGREKAFSTLVRSDHVGALRYLRSHRPGSVSPVVRAGSRTIQAFPRPSTELSRSGTRATEPRTPSCARAYPPYPTSVTLARAARCYDAVRERSTSSINRPSRCSPAPTLRHRVRRAATPLLSAALALDSPVHAGEPLCFGARVEASSVLHATPYA